MRKSNIVIVGRKDILFPSNSYIRCAGACAVSVFDSVAVEEIEGVLYVSMLGEVDVSVTIFPFEGDSVVCCTNLVACCLILEVKGREEVIGMLMVLLLHAEVV